MAKGKVLLLCIDAFMINVWIDFVFLLFCYMVFQRNCHIYVFYELEQFVSNVQMVTQFYSLSRNTQSLMFHAIHFF